MKYGSEIRGFLIGISCCAAIFFTCEYGKDPRGFTGKVEQIWKDHTVEGHWANRMIARNSNRARKEHLLDYFENFLDEYGIHYTVIKENGEELIISNPEFTLKHWVLFEDIGFFKAFRNVGFSKVVMRTKKEDYTYISSDTR